MSDEENKPLSRIEAAAYLTEKGLTIKQHTLAKYANEGTGPPFVKSENGHHTLYDRDGLDAWVAAGGRKRKAGKQGGRPRKGDDLLTVLEQFIPIVERVVVGKGTFADGVLFERMLAATKAAMRRRAGT